MVLGVIQARMSSRRFSGKVLCPLNGVPLLTLLVERLRQASRMDELVVATSVNPADDALVEWSKSSGIKLLRGPEDDVLTRYLQVLDAMPADYVIRITADNPLTDPDLLDINVRNILEKQLDYSYMNNVPLGTASDVFCVGTLRYIDRQTQHPFYREHINAYILEHPDEFRWEFCNDIPPCYRRPDLSFTIDTPEEHAWVQAVLSAIPSHTYASLDSIIAYADEVLEKQHLYRT